MFNSSLNNSLTQGNLSEIMVYGKPNFAAQYAISSGFVAPQNGFVLFLLWSNGAERYGYVNNIVVANIGTGGNAVSLRVFVPVKKGDVITLTNMSAYFVPDYN